MGKSELLWFLPAAPRRRYARANDFSGAKRMIWFTCQKCGKQHSRPDSQAQMRKDVMAMYGAR